ncbi:MAG TPA: aminotransferase class V-fold PLP-dependent enzyme [Terriglobia bacterium]|nr:aminotransferase class V-fold PLP-dependent enzyme [Terriglobia bacterium]
MNIDWESARSEFPALANWTYLNTATYGHVPRRGVAADAAHWARRDEFACSDFLGWYDEADRIRESVARLVHAAVEDIAFVTNSAAALGLIAGGIDWKSGDNLLTLSGEFPNYLYLPVLVARHGVELRQVPWEGFYRAIDLRTRLVAISEVNYVTGFRAPLEEIAAFLHSRGILLYVDGTQSVGALQFDVQKIQPDMLAVHAYKWMISPTGTGFMYVAPSLRTKLPPNVAGWRTDREWRNVDNLHQGIPIFKDAAEKYEGGGSQFGLLHAMGAAVDWILELGPEAIERRVLNLARSARERLINLGAAPGRDTRSQIVAVRFNQMDASQIARELQARRVLVAARQGVLRISPHFYNNESDLERLEGELRTLL